MPSTPKKPQRYSRYNTPGHAHDLTFSCYKRRPLLREFHAEILLADVLNKASLKHNFDIWAYVFMPEHVHLLIYPRESGYSISSILKSIKQPVSRGMINEMKRSNPQKLNRLATGLNKPEYRFWQDGRGYDRNYWEPDEIRKQVDYIHLNPVRRGLVLDQEEYKWSSARDWFTEEEGPIRLGRDTFPM